jgi:hypothetical protein
MPVFLFIKPWVLCNFIEMGYLSRRIIGHCGPITFHKQKTALFMIENSTLEKAAQSAISRRRFFGYAGALAGAGLLAGATGCTKDEEDPGINLGAGDTGVLNYLYAMSQLQAAFYTQAIFRKFNGMNSLEEDYLSDIRNHEIAHREFYKNLLGGSAIAGLEFDFSGLDFFKRTSVIDTAIELEDLSVSAYNGAGQVFTNVDNLKLVIKIASVEARHAAALRDIKQSGSFADATVVNPGNGLDLVRVPNEVMTIMSKYIKTKLNAANITLG